MKRLLSFLLVVTMLLSVVSFSALSATAATDLISETITVDGNIKDTGWDADAWKDVNPDNGYWQNVPLYDDTLSYTYQFRTDGTKLYGAFKVDCELVKGVQGQGTNVRLWLRTNKNATVYTHFYDVNPVALAAKYNTSTTKNSAANIANSSLNAAIVSAGDKTYIEFSVNLAEFGGQNGFEYFVGVSNYVNQNLALFYPPVVNGSYGSTTENLPYSKWYSTAVKVNPADLRLGSISLEQSLRNLAGLEHFDAGYDLVIDAPANYTAGEDVVVKVAVNNIVASGLDGVFFDLCYDNTKLVIANDILEDDFGVLDCVDLTKLPKAWENLSAVASNFRDIEEGEEAVADNDGVINVAAVTPRVNSSSITEDGVLVFEFTFTAKEDADGEVGIWIPCINNKGYKNVATDDGMVIYVGNGDSAVMGSHEHTFALTDGAIKCDCGAVSDYSGLYATDSEFYYAENGVLVSGWKEINGAWHYFDADTLAAVSGDNVKVGGVYFDFDATGKTEGTWVNTLNGKRYYYGPDYYYDGWQEIDGEYYYFSEGNPVTGNNKLPSVEDGQRKWYNFDEDGVCLDTLNGVYELNGKYYYLEDGVGAEKYLIKVDGDYYFAQYDGELVVNTTMYAWISNCDLPAGTYTFGADGKLVGSQATGEIVCVNGMYYYYENGVGVEKGLVKVGNDYYFSQYGGELIVSQRYYAWMTSCDLPAGEQYEFGADGKMLNGIIEKNGKYYYYENGNGLEAGLVKVGNDYYFAGSYDGEVVTNARQYAWLTNCDLPQRHYEFGADGKMLNGIVERDGKYYYYENGNGLEAGLVKVDGDYYFAGSYDGEVVTSTIQYAWMTSCDMPEGRYEFGADGKMLNGIIEKDGKYYYYENGNGVEKGLVCVDGYYYFAQFGGEVVLGQEFYAWMTNCDLPEGKYEFGADGKMLNGIIEKNGELYYYENGKGAEKGLFEYEGGYYFSEYGGKLRTNERFYAWATSCDIPAGTYEFGADGKMLDGIVEKDGKYYYYELGTGVEKGLVYVDGYYYFAQYAGELVVSQSFYVWEANGLLVEATYIFDEFGRIVG